MKNVFLALTALAAVAATPVSAQTIEAEVRLGDVVRDSRTNYDELRVEYNGTAYNFVEYGLELQTRQNENAGGLNTLLAGKLGTALPTFAGVKSSAYAEVGRSFANNNNFEFWGVGANAALPVPGTALSLIAGYRHREGFEAANRMNEERLNAGVKWHLTEKSALGANYYRTTGTERSDILGVALTYKF